ncbi:MAG: hypothetical protein OMM_15039, partial [Candidatus Magnetoglobus multicellularis str. Araruama]
MIKQIENINAFIGRNEAQNIFRQFPFQDKALLNIYSENQGGIGKTWLLLRYIHICKEELSDRLIFQKELIDLYDT